ncbi:MAG: SUMF1/EgtB/PvdO family nonheme iron enzyme [Candidatus Saganbacteria bacterium]|nr:SUMF1/EgtB/PvdO family nonheme iron enzyme [Candidatus Saganbacteria bacterium]
MKIGSAAEVRTRSSMLGLSRPDQPISRKWAHGVNFRKFIESHRFTKVPGMPFRMMKDELTTDQLKQFVRSAQYEIIGNNAGLLQDILARASQREMAGHLSLNDGRAYSKWLSEITGRRFRVPTSEEWFDAVTKVKCKLSGRNWEWTTSIYFGNYFYLCQLGVTGRRSFPPGDRGDEYTVRLIEDLR